MASRASHRRGARGWQATVVEPTPVRQERVHILSPDEAYELALMETGTGKPRPPEINGPFVYFVLSPCKEAVKVGTARNVKKRLCALQAAHHKPMLYVGAIRGGVEDERRLQKEFAGEHIEGEWFNATPKVMKRIHRLIRDDLRAIRECAGPAPKIHVAVI